MRLSISITVAAAILSAGTHAFVPSNSVIPRCCSPSLGMSSVAEPEASTSSDAAPAAADAAPAPADAAPAASDSGVSDAAPAADAAASASGDVNVAAGDRQKLYGKDVDLPETYVMCGRCKTAYALQPDDLGPKGKGR
mmetsp:Transcript_20706/g.59363  ORF Transcript_20706/g.59363 Transcript_20706/m.59363 type:complete len:138 (-) Transcript_20706:1676-2089(-)